MSQMSQLLLKICIVQTTPIFGNMDCPRGWPQGHKNPQKRQHSPLPDPTISDKVTTIISVFVHPLRHSYLIEAFHTLVQKQAVEMVRTPKSRLLQLIFLGSQAKQSLDTYLGP